MQIHKILNNNVVVVLDEENREQVVMGRGLAFKKKCGDEIDPAAIDKVFTMNNPDTNNKFQELVADIPLEYILLVENIITYAKTHIGKKINDSIYISLADHIFMSLTRWKEGIEVKNALLWDIKRFYKDEFCIGLKALEMIKEQSGIMLAEDEAGFIALHFVNAQMEENPDKVEDMYTITKVMQEISNIVKYYFNFEYNEESVYYYRFVTHLKFFAQRLVSNKTYKENSEDDLLDIIKVKYKNAYECVKTIKKFLVEQYDYLLSDEEMLYLTIHIARVVYENER
ncbi:BglG family transcription antiterminator LicT [[Eubacterium] hominis]|uniref:BglG family transcription antiterminator LicT n=1 Tax=[Eubacterium] hominis TaxID=2764325 RepID=UPI003A4DFB3D